jgi:hypothetical protein
MASQPDGALYELVARGKKDVYFVTSNPADGQHPFNHTYAKIEPHLAERRTQVSRNAPAFGNTIEFEIERFGDVLLDATILIDMPTWLPNLPIIQGEQAVDPLTVNKMYFIKAADGYAYGWTNGIAYFLFDTIELFQDKVLIWQTTGEALYFTQKTDGSLSQSQLSDVNTGAHTGSPPEVAANATPGRLRLNIPWPGTGGTAPLGFPLMATLGHTYRLKIKIKKHQQLIEYMRHALILATASNPFDKDFQYTDMSNNTITFRSLGLDQLKAPTIMLETHQAYLRDSMRTLIASSKFTWEIPFRRWFINKFPINENDNSPLATGGQVIINRRLEGVHPASRIVFLMRSEKDIQEGRPWKITANTATQNYWSSAKLLIAGKERELAWGPLVSEDLNNLEYESVGGPGYSSFVFSVDQKMPSGSVNLSQADRPSIQLQLVDASITKSEVLVICETWGIYSIRDERGYVRFIN